MRSRNRSTHSARSTRRPLGGRRDHGSLLAAQPSDSTSRNSDRALADSAMLELAVLNQLVYARKADIEQ